MRKRDQSVTTGPGWLAERIGESVHSVHRHQQYTRAAMTAYPAANRRLARARS